MDKVERQDGSINLDALHFRYEHVAPHHVLRRVATQIGGTSDLRSLSRGDRKWIGRQVAILLEKHGIDMLTLMSNQFEIQEKRRTTTT